MAKKIRFPLNLAEEKQARDLTELREFFSLPEVLGYVADGKLVTWLSDRYENDLADEISALDASDPDFGKKVCEILGVAFQGENVTLEDAQARNEKLAILKKYTDDPKLLDRVDRLALEQDDIYDLLDEDCNIIYLCGEKFTIPLGKEGITYIGVNKPIVVISSKEVVDFQAKKLVFEDVEFDEVYQSLVKSHQEQASYKEQESQRREEALLLREKEVLQREQAQEREKEGQLPQNNKFTLNLCGTLLAQQKETILQYSEGVSCELRIVFDQQRPQYFGLEMYSRQIGFLGVLEYRFEEISHCTKHKVLRDLVISLEERGAFSTFGAVKFLPKHPFPDFLLKQYDFIGMGEENHGK